MGNVIVNAIGEQCPIPVVKTLDALKGMKQTGILEVHVDNEIAVQNVMRLASGKGIDAKSEKIDDKHFVIKMQIDSPVEITKEDHQVSCVPDARDNTVVAIDSSEMGKGDDELGKILMKGFIFALSKLENLPKTVLFYNGGAKIPIEGSVCLDDLKSMEAQGVEIMTCGTCLNYYGLTEKLAVGEIANMYLIVEKLSGASKIIKP